MVLVAALTLLHILVFVYWLGGDLGAFYGSTFMTDPKRSVAERMMALKILNNIDMAPRTALILALPTGIGLGWAKGWLQLSGLAVTAIVIGSAAWLVLAWIVHLQHGTVSGTKRADLAIRYVTALGLAGAGGAGLAGRLELPFFIAVKLCLLAGCIALGLLVRRQLAPLFVAVREMAVTGATGGTDRIISTVNSRARLCVVAIWIMVTSAAYLGVATPA